MMNLLAENETGASIADMRYFGKLMLQKSSVWMN